MRNNFSALLYLVLLFTSSIFAKEYKPVVYLSLVGMNMDYREYNKAEELVDSEKSSYSDMAGVEMKLAYKFNENLKSYSEIYYNFMILGGKSRYKGSYLNSTLGYGSLVSDTSNIIADVDISYRYTTILNGLNFMYGIGIGYHYWDRMLSSAQTEVYTWYSVRPILGLSYKPNKDLELALNVEYHYGFNTLMSSTNPDLDFTLGGVNILDISIPVVYKYDEDMDLFFEFVLQKQNIQESGVEYDGNSGYYEPDSTSYNNYLKLGLAFKF